MKLFYTTLFSLILSIGLNAQWTPVGDGNSLDELTTRQAVLRFHPGSNQPHVLYKEWMINDGEYIRMKAFDGNSWDFVGNELIHQCILVSDHMDFEFHPLNDNIPMVYYSSGMNTNAVVGLNGTEWETYPGLTNFMTDYQLGFGFDLSPTGEPTISFSDSSCPFGPNGTGNLTVVKHDGTEWEVLVSTCFTLNPATISFLEYNPVTDKLLVLHTGGPDLEGNFNFAKTLVEYNVTSWDSLASPSFEGYYTKGRMKINPVSGDVYMYDRDYTDGTKTEDLFRVHVWDGSTLEQIPTDGIVVDHVNYELEFHPITGDPYLIYKDGNTFPLVFNVKRFDGSAWVETEFGNNLADQFMVELFDAQFDPVSGNLFLAMSNNDQSLKVIEHAYNVTAVSERDKEDVHLYPNPANDQLNIVAPAFLNAEIIDGTGKKVLHSNDPRIDVSSLSSGLYYVRIAQKEKTTTQKLLIE